MRGVSRKHLRDVVEYFRGTASYQLNREAIEGTSYFLDLEFTLEDEAAYYMPKDDAGLPMRRYRTVGLQYNPTRIAAFALAHYNRFLRTNDASSREAFLRAAGWFAASKDAIWYYRFDWNELRGPWISCMAQGEGISVLVRAFRLTSEDRYLDCASKALVPLANYIGEGGVRSRIDGDWDFLEEFPTSDPVHVLNGSLYALIGVHDLMRIDSEAGRRVRFPDLIRSLEANLGRWDLGYWSAYDLASEESAPRNAATAAYHRLHITQLTYLGEVLGNSAFLSKARQWGLRSESLASRLRAMASKITYRTIHPAQR